MLAEDQQQMVQWYSTLSCDSCCEHVSIMLHVFEVQMEQQWSQRQFCYALNKAPKGKWRSSKKMRVCRHMPQGIFFDNVPNQRILYLCKSDDISLQYTYAAYVGGVFPSSFPLS